MYPGRCKAHEGKNEGTILSIQTMAAHQLRYSYDCKMADASIEGISPHVQDGQHRRISCNQRLNAKRNTESWHFNQQSFGVQHLSTAQNLPMLGFPMAKRPGPSRGGNFPGPGAYHTNCTAGEKAKIN